MQQQHPNKRGFKRKLSDDELQNGVDIEARQLNQYFTPPALARELTRGLIDILTAATQDYVFIEPSAGSGEFVRALTDCGIPADHVLAVEIDRNLCNKQTDWICADYLQCTAESLRLIEVPKSKRVVIGNPPCTRTGSWTRGGANSLGIQFLNHSAEIADTVGMILGIGVRRHHF